MGDGWGMMWREEVKIQKYEASDGTSSRIHVAYQFYRSWFMVSRLSIHDGVWFGYLGK